MAAVFTTPCHGLWIGNLFLMTPQNVNFVLPCVSWKLFSRFEWLPTYCIMSDHFHLLLEIPDPEWIKKLTVDDLIEKLPGLYSKMVV